MCKCCQLCWEDLYWQCIEEKFCYDESIANYDPADDEYSEKNGHVAANGETVQSPITSQPTRLQRNISMNSAKIHEDEVKREIQTTGINLAPEILQVFQNSQIFHDHKPLKTKTPSPQPATFTLGSAKVDKPKLGQISEEDSKKLLERLEEDKTKSSGGRRVLTTPPRIIETPAINEESEDVVDEVILRPPRFMNIVNKNLILDAPYFAKRPASENDISTIYNPAKSGALANVSSTTDVNRFSMTPEVPSIAFAHLPKNYLDTPAIEKYKKEAPSLAEIQTAEIHKSMSDFSMPRYYGKSDLILNRSFDAVGSTSSIASGGSGTSGNKKHPEKSKRLKNFRTHLPPLTIHSKDKGEKEK